MHRCHTLIVEDDAAARLALARLLRVHGFHVDCAGSVAEALAMLRQYRPDKVILDLELPDGTGLAILDALRQADGHTPVALATGSVDGALLADAVLAHPDAIFTKPLDPTELIAWLSRPGTLDRRSPASGSTPRGLDG